VRCTPAWWALVKEQASAWQDPHGCHLFSISHWPASALLCESARRPRCHRTLAAPTRLTRSRYIARIRPVFDKACCTVIMHTVVSGLQLTPCCASAGSNYRTSRGCIQGPGRVAWTIASAQHMSVVADMMPAVRESWPCAMI